MKIVVYAICKNEEKFISRWVESMCEADKIVVLDTGSTDNSVELLQKLGAKVEVKKIEPWRFDVARNISLSLVDKDTDLCVCTDIDEVFEKGWRKKLELIFEKEKPNRVLYKYVWSHTENGEYGHMFFGEKIHARNDYVWKSPVHETVVYTGEKKEIIAKSDILLEHFPDDTKSRKQYLKLLELAIIEEPLNDRNMHYLGREYFFNGEFNKAIITLEKHLKLPSAVWNEERSASMRYIGDSFFNLKNYYYAELWYLKAICEMPFQREPYLKICELYLFLNNYLGCLFFAKKGLNIKDRTMSYISEPNSFGSYLYDAAAFCCYKLNILDEANIYIDEAIKIEPNNERLINNKIIFEKELNKTNNK